MDSEKRIDMYTRMLRIRYFEEEAVKQLRSGMPGFIHSYVGEEAMAVGVCSAIRPDDYITSTHRGHGHLIAKGAEISKMMAELWGKITGYNKGKGGSMHIAAYELGILGANGIVGGGIPIATGAGLSIKIDGLDKVVVCFFGDGAANQGTFHEAINIASAYSLPVIYVCENNLYGVGTYQPSVRAVENIADRASGYGIAGIVVDGNDVEEVHKATEKAAERARSGKGPTLIEGKTYRWYGHFEGDKDERPVGEVKEWKAKDPILRYELKLLSEGILSQEKREKIISGVEKEIAEAIRFAHQSNLPDISEALTDIYK
ncbi:MAG: thiamine pyrophosphate-dependent dehydrogenase E1 component subunit alpha [Candidatus Omnitrophica bacterium]|nr:thiamine pyrophosphate-dependent dehydrogenase E1 component subunit alpha [Candidatus Omnitrophota bacterium]